MRWLLRKFKLYPNAYYNYLKGRKEAYRAEKAKAQRKIVTLYHDLHGVPGYRMMQKLLIPYGHVYCNATIHKYMKELGIRSIVRRKKPGFRKGTLHTVFPNLLNQNFNVDEPNRIWCTDFTYLYLKGGKVRYNCTIIDLYDRSVVATLNSDQITSELAKKTMKLAIERHKPGKGLLIHSDQGSQFTSKDFNQFCETHFIQQSMSRTGCPFDNAPMERYFNTLKNECTNLFVFKTESEIDTAIADFAYGWYNRVRPHTYNRGLPPIVARVA